MQLGGLVEFRDIGNHVQYTVLKCTVTIVKEQIINQANYDEGITQLFLGFFCCSSLCCVGCVR